MGTGVGLPGIPLAILAPGVSFTLIDRSQRRCDLAARAVRILGLDNVTVECVDINDVDDEFDLIVMRASLTIHRAWEHFARLLSLDGQGVFGLTASGRPPGEAELQSLGEEAARHGLKFEVVEFEGLDSPSVLLRIAST